MENKKELQSNKSFPPVVSVLGHVDHGKTSLLDAVRNTSVTSKERGGITQNIGASRVEIKHEGKKRVITFIDTPGHLAFANMRSQGVNAADIVLLVIAADDGVKPQTRESIKIIQEAKTPFIVVFTKTDLETANIERVKQELLKEGVLLEGMGGNVPFIGVSAKNNDNITALLELILLVYDVANIEKDENKEFLGVVIDAKLDKKRGVVTTVVIKQGKLTLGETIYIPGRQAGKIKALFSTDLKSEKVMYPGDVCEILGITEVLPMGAVLSKTPSSIAPLETQKEKVMQVSTNLDLATFFGEKSKNSLPIVLKTDTSGEMEAVKNSLPSDVEVVYGAQGEISVSDILLAKDFKALLLGFNVKIAKDADKLAETEKVMYRVYQVIYELLDEVEEVIEQLSEEGKERILGKANILASFPGKSGAILGLSVVEGRIALHDKVRIMRNDKEIGDAKIQSLKRAKNDIKEAGRGSECGVSLSASVDFVPGDVLISYS